MALLEACDVSINGRYLEFYVLSSVESRSLGDNFFVSWCCYATTDSFGIQNESYMS